MAIPGARRIRAAAKKIRPINPLAKLTLANRKAYRRAFGLLKNRERHLVFLNERRQELQNGAKPKTAEQRQRVLDELKSIETQTQQTTGNIARLNRELDLIGRPKKGSAKKK